MVEEIMKDKYSEERKKLEDKLNDVYQDIFESKKARKQTVNYCENIERDIHHLEGQVLELENKRAILSEHKVMMRQVLKDEIKYPLILLGLLALTLPLASFVPESLVVVNFLQVLLSFSLGINLAVMVKNIFVESKRIREVKNKYTLKELEEAIGYNQELISGLKSVLHKKEETLDFLDKRLAQLYSVMKEIKEAIELVKEEKEKALAQYYQDNLGFQSYLQDSFIQNESLLSLKKVLEK